MTKIPKTVPARVKEELLKGRVDWVTFTSSSTVENFVKIIGLKNTKRLARHTRLASIGPVTTKALKEYGLKASCQAKVYTVEGLINALSKR